MSYTILYNESQHRYSLKNKIGRALWGVVYILLFRPFGTKYLNFWRVFILRLFGAKIGQDCSVSCSVKIWAPWNLEMEDHSMFASRVNCYNPSKIKLNSQVIVSDGVFLCGASHDVHSPQHTLISKPIEIMDQAWIASDAFIMMGVTIGQGAVVGARACVFKDVEPWTIVGGNPAKFIKKRIIRE